MPCSRVPTGNCAVSIRVRVATLEDTACCTAIARLLADGWVTARLVPWGSGWVLVACTVVWRPLSRVTLSNSWKVWSACLSDSTSAWAVWPEPIRPWAGTSSLSNSPLTAGIRVVAVAWGSGRMFMSPVICGLTLGK
ncbi:hypothetical protein D3C76_1068310 [compost metagenome]